MIFFILFLESILYSVLSNLICYIIGITDVGWCFCRTPIGRGRAWLYLAVMQKKLADYLKVLLDHKNLLRYLFFKKFQNVMVHCTEREVFKVNVSEW